MIYYVIQSEDNNTYVQTETMIPTDLPNITFLTKEEYDEVIFNILGTKEIEIFE